MSKTSVLEAHGQRLEVAPWRGGLATSYRVHGREIFYLDQASFDGGGSVRGGIPVLFPWAGPLPDGTFGVEGKLPQHGVARQSAWEEAGPGIFVLRSSEETLKVYPWKFELRQKFELTPDGLYLETHVLNLDERSMPVQLGFHPYFAVTDKSKLEFELPGRVYRDSDTPDRADQVFPGTLAFTDQPLDWELRDLQQRRAVMREGSHSLTLEWSPDFPVFVCWHLWDKPFVCLEPWSAGRFAQTTADPDLWHVAPGESRMAWWRIRCDS